ncbi:MAG: hypothetical protein AABP62_28165 [Planctomycetota bacterium]
MTFPLTQPGKENLEAILAEFERAGRCYRPLYHERLIGWSETSEVRLSDAQWQAFIDAESNNLDDGEWSEWDGPHSASPGFNGTYLGRWYGDPGGMPEFFNLVESLTDVLKREDFSSVDDLRTPFSFRSWIGWLSTIHSWAFRFQMPLLRCELSPWGVEDPDPDDFFELMEQMSQTGDIYWPKHPACWSLTYNVFTSSAAAIRAILRPKTVIGVNEPWPYAMVDTGTSSNEQTADKSETPQFPEDEDESVSSCHRLVRDPRGWSLQLADSNRRIFSKHQAGLHRIATLIQNSGESFPPKKLYQYGARPVRSGPKILNRNELDDSDGLSERTTQSLRQSKDDEVGRRQAGEQLRELLEVRAEAIRTENLPLLEKTEMQIAVINQSYYVKDDGTVARQRLFTDPDERKPYDTVCATIRDAIRDIKRQLPGQVEPLNELESQLVFPDLMFQPKANHARWLVVRQD